VADSSVDETMKSRYLAGIAFYLFLVALVTCGVVYTLWLLQYPDPSQKGGIVQADWSIFGVHLAAIDKDAQMLLLVVLMGAFGSAVYALKSLADYKGEGRLTHSWLTFYLVQPVEGAGIAVLLYLVIRGGFLAGTGSDIKNANTFGMCAIAGLAGAFSDTAFAKLKEVFDTLFKPTDTRSGKLTSKLSIEAASLPNGVHGTDYGRVQLTAKNGVAPLHWAVVPPLPAGLSLDPDTGEISGTPTAASPKASYTFKVMDTSKPPVAASKVLTLTIS